MTVIFFARELCYNAGMIFSRRAVVVFAAAFACAAFAQESEAPPDLQAGAAKYGEVCAACHGPNGASVIPANPILAGQHSEYLAAQTRLYRDGGRQNPVMGAMAKGLSDEEIRDIAAFLAARPPVIVGAADVELARSAEMLYRGGDLARGVPACAACHSPTGAGIPPVYPRVSGQHAEYAAATLREYANGTRENDVMAAIAKRLSEEEIVALAEYLSGLAR